MNLSTITYTPQTSRLVSVSNDESFCGETGWELNTAKDVAAKTCFSTAETSSIDTKYGLYIFDGGKFI
jgi:hypothetical protein